MPQRFEGAVEILGIRKTALKGNVGNRHVSGQKQYLRVVASYVVHHVGKAVKNRLAYELGKVGSVHVLPACQVRYGYLFSVVIN